MVNGNSYKNLLVNVRPTIHLAEELSTLFGKNMAPLTRQDLEWLRSSEAASRGVTAAEIEASEELCERAEKVESHIRSAFAGCLLSEGIGLWEADALDDYADPEQQAVARAKDEREDWQRVSTADLFRCNSALNFTDALGYRFLLPAFMIADLDGGIDETVVIHLSLTNEDRHGTRSGLSYAQLETVLEFLELFLDDLKDSFHHESIKQALNVFWRPLLQQRKEAEQGGGADPAKLSD